MKDSMAMLDALREAGFTPNDDGDMFDLSTGTTYTDRMVRVEMDDTEVIIRSMTGNEVERWNAKLNAAPLSVFVSTLRLAIADAKTK